MIDVELIGAPAFSVSVAGDVFTYAAINRRLAGLIGCDPADFVGHTPQTMLLPGHAEEVLVHYRRCVADRTSVDFESYHESPGGGRWWHTTLSPVLEGGDGRVGALIGVRVDITPRKLAERRAREVNARIALAMDLLDGGFWHYSIADERFEVSPQLSRLAAGADAAPLDGDAYAGTVVHEDRGLLDIAALVRGDTDVATVEYRLRTGDGDVRWVSCRRRLTRDDAGRPEKVIGVVVDITDQKRRRDALAAEAATDSLTDLSNRRGFDALGGIMAARARGEGDGFGLVLLDLDRFKPVNDTHGHAVGDEVLREVAARLRRHLRPGDVAARLGGDEFAVLVAGATDDVLAGLSRRLVEAVGRPFATAAGRIEIGASVGAALWRDADGTLAALAERADAALFAVKRAGRSAWMVAA